VPSSDDTAQAGSIARALVVKRVPCNDKGRSLDSRRSYFLPLFTELLRRLILGTSNRSKSQPLATDPRYNHSYRSGSEAKIRLKGAPMPLGAGLSGREGYVELPRKRFRRSSHTRRSRKFD
jgi:hypothetical protein